DEAGGACRADGRLARREDGRLDERVTAEQALLGRRCDRRGVGGIDGRGTGDADHRLGEAPVVVARLGAAQRGAGGDRLGGCGGSVLGATRPDREGGVGGALERGEEAIALALEERRI